MKTISINNGYYQYKSINQTKFLSRVSKALCDIPSGCDTVEIENQTYLVGVGDVNVDKDKTENEWHTKILILNMIAKFMDTKLFNKDVFNLILSSPPAMYRAQAKALPNYLKGNYQITVNKTPVDITINNVKVYPETFIIFINYQEKFKDKNVIIFDMGGVTTNIVCIRNNSFTENDFICENYGMYHIDQQIAQYLNGKEDYSNHNFSVEDIQYMREVKHEILVKEQPYIDEIYDKHIENMINKMKLKGFNYNLYSFFCTGGGSSVLFDNILLKVNNAELSPDPIFDNEKALEKLAQRELGR